MKTIFALVMTTALTTAGLAQTPPGTVPADSVSAATGPTVQIPRTALPYMAMRIAPPPTPSGSERKSFVGGYTRLIVRYRDSVADAAPGGDGRQASADENEAAYVAKARDYRSERRGDLKRWLFGKSITRVLTLKTNLIRPRLTTQVIVASVERQSSSRAGESWTTEFNADRQLTPLFRIDPDTTVSVEAALSLSSSYDSAAARTILEVVRRGAALVAPAVTLVTPLSQKRYDDASGFIDSSITNLMKESITERGINDFALSAMTGTHLMTIVLDMPMGNKITPKSDAVDGTAPIALGLWEIWSAPATLSVFSDVPWIDEQSRRARRDSGGCGGSDQLRQACAAFARLDPQTVLNFAVDDNVSVAQALAGEQAIAGARDALVTATDKNIGKTARALCGLVIDKAHRLGFNRYDVAAVVWAYASNSNLANNAEALRDVSNCAPLDIAYQVGLSKLQFAAAPPADPS